MPITPVFLDAETYWDAQYSLKKMSAIEYVFDERYETISFSMKLGLDGDTDVAFGHDDCAYMFSEVNWDSSLAVAHNMSEFDALILAHKFGIKPRMWGCTLAMARPHHAKGPGGSLAALARHYNLTAKGSLEATNTKGKRLSEFSREERDAMREYNRDDTDICAQLFRKLLPKTPRDEMNLIDRTIRMLVEPQFKADVPLLLRGLAAEKKRKQLLLASLSEITGSTNDAAQAACASAAKFGKILESFGATIPLKPSPSNPDKQIPALAKTDKGMADLLQHTDPRVQTAAEVRLGVKSTQLETRLGRFVSAAEAYGGMMPIPLRYCGADTTARWSGTMALNMQNLPRIGKTPKLSDVLRYSLRAPDGWKVVVADLSAIELRMNHTFWGVQDTIDRFEADAQADLYKAFAAESLYNKPEAEITSVERFVAKIAQLQLGYRSGWFELKDAVRQWSGGDVLLTDDEARRIVQAWRATYHDINKGWKTLDHALSVMHAGDTMDIDQWGLCRVVPGGIKTPKWLIQYPNLERRIDEKSYSGFSWWYKSSRGLKKLHGGVVCENISQHLSGQVLKDAIVEYEQTDYGREYPLAHQVHDEVVFVVRDEDAQGVLDCVQRILRASPKWFPKLTTWSEGSLGQTYGEAK